MSRTFASAALPAALPLAQRLGLSAAEDGRGGTRIPPLCQSEGYCALVARADGEPTALIGLTWIRPFQALICLPTSKLRTARDLRDRKVGLPSVRGVDRAYALRAASAALEVSGLHHRQVSWVDRPSTQSNRDPDTISPFDALASAEHDTRYAAEEIAALNAGTVDAIYVHGVEGLRVARDLGARIVFSAADHPDDWVRANTAIPLALTLDDLIPRTDPAFIAGTLAAIRAASAWAQTHPREFVRFLAESQGATEREVSEAYGEGVHKLLMPDLSDPSLAAFDVFRRFLLRWSFIWTDFDVRAWADRRPLTLLAAQGEPGPIGRPVELSSRAELPRPATLSSSNDKRQTWSANDSYVVPPVHQHSDTSLARSSPHLIP